MGFDLEATLAEKRAVGLYRRRRLVGSAQCSRLVVDGRELLAFCSNDYLSLANHPAIKQALRKAWNCMAPVAALRT